MTREPSTAADWRPVETGCPVCSSTARRIVGRRGGRAHHAGRGVTANIVRCESCACLYAFPTLLPIGNPYEAHSGDEYFAGHDSRYKRGAGARLARRAESMLGRRGRMLELGCGRGELLEGARDAGWVVRGVDQTAEFARAAEGVEIEIAGVDEATSLSERYDVVVLAAILEHLYEPVRCLRRVHDALAPGGLVFIEVPNEYSLWHRLGNTYLRMCGRDWVLNLSPTFPPYHVVGFSPRVLTTALDTAGFELLEIGTLRYNNDVTRRAGLRARIEHAASGAILHLGQALGMGVGIMCWAQRPARERTVAAEGSDGTDGG